MTIDFITGNNGKFTSLQHRLSESDIILNQTPLELVEPQNMDIQFVSRYKATEAYRQLQKPLIVHDSGFFIEALNGFPGPYIKDVSELIGNAGILKLMHGENNRKAKFISCLTYCDQAGCLHSFTFTETGTLATDISDNNSTISWGKIWAIYKPDWGGGKVLSMLSDKEIQTHEIQHDKESEFFQFAEWAKSHA